MLSLIAAACLTPTKLDIPWPNVQWVAPLGKSGRYAVMTRDSGSAKAVFRVWPDKGDVWFRARASVNGAVATPDGRHLILGDWLSGGAVYEVGRSKPVVDGISAGLIHGKPAAVKYGKKGGATYLQFDGKRILPPAKRQFLMIAPQGDWIATERPAPPGTHRGAEAWMNKYYQIVELWRLDSSGKLKFVRSLGEHWYDGGSSGVPSLLAVAGNGLALVDQPSGGGYFQAPVWIPLGQPPENPFDKLRISVAQITNIPSSFAEGILCPVVLVDGMAHQLWNEWMMHQVPPLDLGTTWLAWMDGESVWLKPPPAGFLNAWPESPTEMGYAVKVSGGVEVRREKMPPSDWWKPR